MGAIWGLGLCLGLSVGCQSPRESTVTARSVSAAEAMPATELAAILARPELTLEDLLALVQVYPRVVAARHEVRATAGEAWQRELRPNPAVGAAMEDLALDELDAGRSTTWVGYTQPLVLGDRLSTARRLGLVEVAAREQGVVLLVHDLQGQVRLAWLELGYVERRRALYGELAAEVETVRGLLEKRIDRGAAAASELARVTLTFESLVEQQRQAERELRTLQVRLQQWLGRGDLSPERLRPPVFDAAPRTQTEGSVAAHPALRQARQAVAMAEERLAHERALAVPDVDVGVSVGRDHGADEGLLELSVSVPWTVFDRRQGAILAAEATLAADTSRLAAVEAELSVALAALEMEIGGGHEALAAHDARIMPAAEADYAQTVERFRAGKSSVLDMLDALRGRAEVRLRRLELLHGLNRSVADLQNLTMFPSSSTPTQKANTP